MCAFHVEDRIGEHRIYESVRRIYDIRSSSEDSLDNRKRRHDKSSVKNYQKATRTASLFIDRIKNDFQRDVEFVPRFRTRSNWCPKFTAKYFSETKQEEEQPRSLDRRNVSKSLVSVTPKVYSIGLNEPKKKTRRKIELNNEIDRERFVDNLKRCSFSVRRNSCRNKMDTKKWMPKLLSSSIISIPPLINIPMEFHLPSVNENNKFVRSDVTIDDSVYYSLSQESLFEEDDKFDQNECSTGSNKKLSDSRFISKQFIPKVVETLQDVNPPKELVKDFFLEDISSIDSHTSKCGEFFTPLETTRKVQSISEDECSDNGILEDIKKRIDKDFERISSSTIEEETLEDFSCSNDSSFFDKNYYFDYDYERFFNSNDDHVTSIEQSKSLPIMSSNKTHYHSSKSLTLISSTLVNDDFSDRSSSRLSKSKNIIEKLHDFKEHSITDRSSMNSTIYYDYNYDFPFGCQESMILDSENEKTHSTKSSFNKPKMTPITCDNKIDLSSELNLSRTTLHNKSLTRPKISEHLVESIDSGVITDYSRNEFHVSSYVPTEKQQFYEQTSTYNVCSDSICSDDSHDRRVDRAIQKCTKDLIILERRVKLKLKTIGTRFEKSRNNFFTFFDWFNGDECIGSISTPSLVSLTDSETS